MHVVPIEREIPIINKSSVTLMINDVVIDIAGFKKQ
jgi:hypothetical protein